jgi:hypothetical protein
MKKLVLGALLAVVASSTGCIITSESTDAVVTARWSFTHFADGSARSCPVGYTRTTVYAQPWDPIENRLFGTVIADVFNCSDASGTTDPLDGIFLVWVQVEKENGDVYARSKSIFLDTEVDGDVTLDFPILDDAGNFFLTWDLVDAQNNAPLTCKTAGVTGNSGVETVATIVGTSFMLVDKFDCNDYFGTTSPLIAGNYTVSVDAFVNNAAVGVAPALTNKRISSPNGLTDLGHIVIPID